MNVVRINTAHQSIDDTKKVIANVREVSEKIAILIDTKGPEVRTTKVATGDDMEFTEGSTVLVSGNPEKESSVEHVCVNHENFGSEIAVGQKILFDDGAVELLIESIDSGIAQCKVLNSGSIGSRKTVSVPGAKFSLESVTKKDREYIKFAAQEDLAFIAHSFIRHKEDLQEVQAILDAVGNNNVQIIAKIENQQGVDNIDEILDNCFGIMVARGDLGVEVPGHKVPSIQKRLIRQARSQHKVVIVATQMLHSMIKNPRPTRAEINDVATAVYDYADAVMLSGESAYGEYPRKAVQLMTTICEEVENELAGRTVKIPDIIEANDIPSYLSLVSVHAATALELSAVVVDTTFGTTPRRIAGHRGTKPIYAFCYNEQTMRQMALCRGIYADYMQPVETSEDFVRNALRTLGSREVLTDDDKVAVIAGNFAPQHGASFIEISTVKNLKRDHQS